MTRPLHAVPAPRLAREAIVRACATGGARAVVQPLVRLEDGAVVGYEVLGRVVEHADCGPADWLDAADEHGLRVELELAFLRAAAELGAPPQGVSLFVNVSAATMLDGRLDGVLDALPPHVLELSEHDRIDDYAQLLPRLRAWRARGTHVAVDDVGAGYASLSHVLQLDPAYVKIDRFLVSGVDRDPRRRAVVAALHTLAAASGALSVAEGVERPQELAVLRELGVDLAQGYLLARPAEPWPGVSTHALDTAVPHVDVSGTHDAHAVAARVSAALAKDPELLPSVYLVRGGRLRCVARQGQWLVLDGIDPGLGITGDAYARDEEVLVRDVSRDPRYRQSVPGVLSELAVPLRAGGRLVGVLNVDARRVLTDRDVLVVRRAAVAVEQRLAEVGIGADNDSLLQRVGRSAPSISTATGLTDLADATLRAALDLGSFDTGCLWSADGRPRASRGPDAALLEALEAEAVAALRELVRDIASCYSDGPDLDLATGPTALLRDCGVLGVALVPIRDGRHLTGFLLLTRRGRQAVPPAETVQAAELIALLAGSRAATLQRLAELEQQAARDPLTGVANRSRLDRLLDDPEEAGAWVGGWLAAIDLDRFKQVNDRFGHAAGDEVLRALARTLATAAGDGCVVRLGGDEFAVLLAPCDDAAALQRCEELRDRTREVLASYGADVSIGLAPIVDESGLRLAMVHADEALYLRKHSGGGGVTAWSELHYRVPSQPPGPGRERRRLRC